MCLDSLFNPADETSLGGQFGEFLVVLQQLRGGLGDHDVVVPLERILGDRVVGRVGRKDCLGVITLPC